MEEKARKYIDSYFAAYKKSNEIKFLDQEFLEKENSGQEGAVLLAPEQIADSLLSRPVLINKRSTYVDLNFSGVGLDYCKRYTYFDLGNSIINHLKDDELVILHPSEYRELSFQMHHMHSREPHFFKHIHEFPQLLLSEKSSDFDWVNSNPYQTRQDSARERVFSTVVPVIGNIDLFYLIGGRFNNSYSIEQINRYLQNAAIHPGAESRCRAEAKTKIIIRFNQQIDSNDVSLIRTLQNQTIGQIERIEAKLLEAKIYFEETKSKCFLNLCETIRGARQKKIDDKVEADKKSQAAVNLKRLLNDF